MSGLEMPPDPFPVVIDIPLAEDQGDLHLVIPVRPGDIDDFIRMFQQGVDVLDEDEDLEFPYRNSTVWVPRSSLELAIEQLRGAA